MTIVKGALPVLDSARALLDTVGLRPYSLEVRVTRWAGSKRIGGGAKSVETVALTVANGGRPKVRQLEAKEIAAQGGQYHDEMFEIGPFTPDYEFGGMAADVLNPTTDNASEVHYILKGPGLPTDGAVCTKVSHNFTSPFRMTITIKRAS